MLSKDQKQAIFDKVCDYLLLKPYEAGELNVANELFTRHYIIHVVGMPIDAVILSSEEENVVCLTKYSSLFRVWPVDNRWNAIKFFFKAWRKGAYFTHVAVTWEEIYKFG